MFATTDTIVAIATPPGAGAIGGDQLAVDHDAGLHRNRELPGVLQLLYEIDIVGDDHVDLAAMGRIGLRKNVPAGEAQPEACEKFRFDPDTAGAATFRRWARIAQPSPPSASADN